MCHLFSTALIINRAENRDWLEERNSMFTLFLFSLLKKKGKTKPTNTSRSFSHTDKNNTLSA